MPVKKETNELHFCDGLKEGIIVQEVGFGRLCS